MPTIERNPEPGGCPGGAPYGHGFNRTVVHAGGCCARWEAEHQPERSDPWADLTDDDKDLIRSALVRAWEVWLDWRAPGHPDLEAKARQMAKDAVSLAGRLSPAPDAAEQARRVLDDIALEEA